MKPITVFRGTTGLNTVADPARIPMRKGNVNDVAEAVNITIDQYFRSSRREGFTLLQSGSYHSLYCDQGDCFVARGDAIFRVGTDFSLQGIRSGMTENARIAWMQDGNKTYYTNVFERGIIEDGVSSPWVVGTYHGPATVRGFAVPVGMKHLCIHAGRMFASTGKVLWWSEPFRFDLFNQAESFAQFHSNIRLIKAVAGGVFVGTERSTHFLSGSQPMEFQARKVANFPPVEWSDSIEYVEGTDIGMQEQGLCALWASIEGAVLGTPSGQIVNLNKEKIIYPENVTQGFGGLKGYHFIHGME